MAAGIGIACVVCVDRFVFAWLGDWFFRVDPRHSDLQQTLLRAGILLRREGRDCLLPVGCTVFLVFDMFRTPISCRPSKLARFSNSHCWVIWIVCIDEPLSLRLGQAVRLLAVLCEALLFVFVAISCDTKNSFFPADDLFIQFSNNCHRFHSQMTADNSPQLYGKWKTSLSATEAGRSGESASPAAGINGLMCFHQRFTVAFCDSVAHFSCKPTRCCGFGTQWKVPHCPAQHTRIIVVSLGAGKWNSCERLHPLMSALFMS